MKKTLSLILASVLIVFSAAAFVGCDNKSQNAKLGLQAMDEGDYDRAKRLYNFAIEHGEADSEDKQIFEILTAYIEANRCLKSEDFSEGLDILDDCRYDYSSLSINDDMDNLYNKLSDGKYADERIKALTGVVNAADYDRAKNMYEEIGKLDLTSSQQDRLYALSRIITNETKEAETVIYYKVNRDRDEEIPLYYEAYTDSDVICRIGGGTKVEVISFAEGGFIEVYYDSHTGFVKASQLVPEGSVSDKDDDDEKDAKDEKKNEQDKTESEKNDDKAKDSSESTSTSSKAPIEAISANDTLTVLTGVNFRSEPSTESEITDVVPEGAEITYLGEMEHGFYKVSYKGKVGYVYSDYVSK